jgi:hypothetical protein
MYEMIETPDDILAVRIAGGIRGDDLKQIMDRLEVMMAANRKVHVYAETHAIDEIEIAGLAPPRARAAQPLSRSAAQPLSADARPRNRARAISCDPRPKRRRRSTSR